MKPVGKFVELVFIDKFHIVCVRTEKCIELVSWLPDTSATRHIGIKTLWDTSAPISRRFDTKNVVRDTLTRVP